jgi:hypothetical protein
MPPEKSFSYAWWAEALRRRYFNEAFAGEPVTLCVDSDELASITGLTPNDAVESLAAAVRLVVMPGHRYSPLGRKADRWGATGCEGPPPSLPVLALSVLAATRMTAQDNHSFYRPYRQLLDPTDQASGIPGDYGDVVPELWEQLRWWLEDHEVGRLGLPTITRHPQLVNIGYSMQQAVLRASDRRRVYLFLRSIGFEPGEEVNPSELRRSLSLWSRRRGFIRLTKLTEDESLCNYAEALLGRIADAWDGRLRDEVTGVRSLPISLTLRARPWRLGFVLMRAADLPTEVVLDVDGAPQILTSEGDWFAPAPLPIPVSASELSGGLRLPGAAFTAFFEPADVYVLQHHDGLYRPVQRGKIAYGESGFLLVRDHLVEVIERWLHAEGAAGRVDPTAKPALPNGWSLIKDFRIDARPKTTPPAVLSDLLGSAGGSRLRLVGGLPMPGLRRTYLTRGAPRVALPSDAADRKVALERPGFGALQLTAQDGELPLSVLPLEASSYEVTNGSTTVVFDLVDGLCDVPPPNTGSVRLVGREGRSAAGFHADVARPRGPYNVRSFGARYVVVLGRSDNELSVARRPDWLQQPAEGPLTWSSLDVWVDFEPVWVLVPLPEGFEAHAAGVRPAGLIDPTSHYAVRLGAATLHPGADLTTMGRWKTYREACGCPDA